MDYLYDLKHYYIRANPSEEQLTGLADIGFDDFHNLKPLLFSHKKPTVTIHIVFSGSGTYRLEDQTYSIKAGEMFFTPLNTTLCYYPNEADPWHYAWFSLSGDQLIKLVPLLGMDKGMPYRTIKDFEGVKDILNRLYLNCSASPNQKVFYGVAAFMELIALEGNSVESQADQKMVYIQTIKKIIHNNFAAPDFTVDAICDMMHLSHSYICRIFNAVEGCTVSSYIESVRLSRAAELLTSTGQSVSAIATLAGYNDPLHFMKRFKAKYGVTALNYRKGNKSDEY
ncbi:MAG: helix-turn-helix domain-containing protein [Clostridia bacterium]|nr:helix-turn-helix domain-containing protein [Clostridia bacterium]